MDVKAHDLVHVGYEPDSKSYCLWNPATCTIIFSQDIKFYEACLPLHSMDIHQLPPEDAENLEDNFLIGVVQNSIPVDSTPSVPLVSSPPSSPMPPPLPS